MVRRELIYVREVTVLRSFTSDEDRPDHGAFLIRDSTRPEQRDRDPRLDEDPAGRPSVCGGFAVAGNGRLFAGASAAYARVLLELHDSDPGRGSCGCPTTTPPSRARHLTGSTSGRTRTPSCCTPRCTEGGPRPSA